MNGDRVERSGASRGPVSGPHSLGSEKLERLTFGVATGRLGPT